MIYIDFYIIKEFAVELNKEIIRSMKILEIIWRRNTLKLVLCHCQMQALANPFSHRFGYNNQTARDPHKKNLRYADGVLPGSGSPDHHSTVTQEVSPPPTHSVGNR